MDARNARGQDKNAKMLAMVSSKIAAVLKSIGPFMQFTASSDWALRRFEPGICDLVFGNPHDMPIDGYSEALRAAAVPRNKDWFAYTLNDPDAQVVVAKSLAEWKGLVVEPEDVFLTSGAFSAIPILLNALIDPGDEVMYMSPPWFFYEAMIISAGARPVRVDVRANDFDLDLEAIKRAITPATRLVMINSPNNPTGRIYPTETLEGLAGVLRSASERNGRPIYLLSDEAYSRIVFDGREFVTPVAFYENAFLVYTYGKTHLTPGQRLGYIAVPQSCPDRERLRATIMLSQVLMGWGFASALMQHAIADLDPLSIDISHLQRRRDWLISELTGIGYRAHSPEGTFYLLPKSPIEDDVVFTKKLSSRDTFVLPGAMVELPGYFRISLTASDEMIERSIPAFKEAFEEA